MVDKMDIIVYFVYVVAIAAQFVSGTISKNSSDHISSPVLLWWRKEPLIFSKNTTLTDLYALDGLLPEIWRMEINSCKDLCSQHSECFDNLQPKELRKPLQKLAYSDVIGSRGLAMPIKLREDQERVQGMSFIKLLDSPGIAVIIKKTLAGTDLLKAILMAWPILIFVVLSALLSGFFIWFLEYRSNPEMFDPFCPKGVLNGFWWASVTMTTVGYGDITPKTVLGRLFTILWISAGLVILAMYMGIVTTSLTTTRLEGTHHFYGITVAAVNQTEEEKFGILHNAHLKVQDDELQVIDAVHLGKDGVKVGFLDFYLASFYSDVLRKKQLHIVRVIPRGRAYGVLLGKDWAPEVVNCLRRYSEDNRHVMHYLIPKYITVSEREQGLTEYFSGSAFGYSIYALLGLFCLLMVLGFGYDRGYFGLNDKD